MDAKVGDGESSGERFFFPFKGFSARCVSGGSIKFSLLVTGANKQTNQ